MNGQYSLPIGRKCFRPPIPEIQIAAEYLDQAVSAHISGGTEKAEKLIRAANIPAIRDWVESLWGKKSPYVLFRPIPNSPAILKRTERLKLRMPNSAEKRSLHLRDGYSCRFCGIPVIRPEVRNRLRNLYPDAVPWSAKSNKDAHPAFQAMWAQYDHVPPHARGGNNDLANLIVTCAPCNFARMNYTLEEVGLADPRLSESIHSAWDGLERLLTAHQHLTGIE